MVSYDFFILVICFRVLLANHSTCKHLQVLAFVEALESRKITVTVRQTRGLDASAACGQLRNDFQKTPLVESSESESQPTPA